MNFLYLGNVNRFVFFCFIKQPSKGAVICQSTTSLTKIWKRKKNCNVYSKADMYLYICTKYQLILSKMSLIWWKLHYFLTDHVLLHITSAITVQQGTQSQVMRILVCRIYFQSFFNILNLTHWSSLYLTLYDLPTSSKIWKKQK